MLVERRGLLVTRGDIVDRLWGKDVFVDVETGVHTAIRKIRQALRDSAEEPVCIETVSGKGYRFIAPVEVVGAESPPAPAASLPAPVVATPARARIGLGLVAVAALAGITAWAALGRDSQPSSARLAVLPFENLSGDPDRDYLADGLTEEMIASLGQIDPDRVSVVGRTSVMTYERAAKSVAEIGRELNADYLVESSIRAESDRLRITAKLIRVLDQVQVWSQTYNREPTSMLGLQQELSAGIAEQIRFRLSPERADCADTTRTEKRRRLRPVSARPQLRQPAHAGDDPESHRALPACHATGPRLCARLVRARECLCCKPGQQRWFPARNDASGTRGRPAGRARRPRAGRSAVRAGVCELDAGMELARRRRPDSARPSISTRGTSWRTPSWATHSRKWAGTPRLWRRCAGRASSTR